MNIFILKEFIPRKTDNRGRIISVFLRGKGIMQNFRCHTCGKIAFQYSGEIKSIFDGAKMTEEASIDVFCKNCKIKYRAMEIK